MLSPTAGMASQGQLQWGVLFPATPWLQKGSWVLSWAVLERMGTLQGRSQNSRHLAVVTGEASSPSLPPLDTGPFPTTVLGDPLLCRLHVSPFSQKHPCNLGLGWASCCHLRNWDWLELGRQIRRAWSQCREKAA